MTRDTADTVDIAGIAHTLPGGAPRAEGNPSLSAMSAMSAGSCVLPRGGDQTSARRMTLAAWMLQASLSDRCHTKPSAGGKKK